MIVALLLAIIIIYLILAAQFESFVHPLTIMLSLPLSVVGALGALAISGMTLNIFSMIGVIMLMGLVTKNAILLVDYANQLRGEQGMSAHEALLRRRPRAAETDPDDHRRDDRRHDSGRIGAVRRWRSTRPDGHRGDRWADHLDAAHARRRAGRLLAFGCARAPHARAFRRAQADQGQRRRELALRPKNHL
jgi:hypothetical protein